jgi:DNA-binding GntR family transcriptional regulator
MKRRSPEPPASVPTTAPQDVSRHDSAGFEVYRQLRSDIVGCVLKPDEKLRFDALRSRYTAGIGTLREALSHLVSDGLVQTEAGRGFRVAPVSVQDLLDITEWRVEFEVRAISQAIQRGDDAWEAEIVTSFHLFGLVEMPEPDAPTEQQKAWDARHRRFHDALVAACGSPWLLHFRSALFDHARRYQVLSLSSREARLTRKHEEHRQLMKAVLERNTERAVQLAEQHIRRTTDMALREMSVGSDPSLKSRPASAPRRRTTPHRARASAVTGS